MAKDTMKYAEAVNRLEAIVAELETGETDIDTLCAQLKTAQKLIKLCKDRLAKTDVEIKKLLADD